MVPIPCFRILRAPNDCSTRANYGRCTRQALAKRRPPALACARRRSEWADRVRPQWNTDALGRTRRAPTCTSSTPSFECCRVISHTVLHPNTKPPQTAWSRTADALRSLSGAPIRCRLVQARDRRAPSRSCHKHQRPVQGGLDYLFPAIPGHARTERRSLKV